MGIKGPEMQARMRNIRPIEHDFSGASPSGLNAFADMFKAGVDMIDNSMPAPSQRQNAASLISHGLG